MEDVKMTDVGEIEDVKSPESMMAAMASSPRDLPQSAPPLTTTSGELDSWIEILSKCKQLPEEDVKRLCDKVSPLLSASSRAFPSVLRSMLISVFRLETYYKKNQMYNQYGVQSPCAETSTANSTTYKNYSV